MEPCKETKIVPKERTNQEGQRKEHRLSIVETGTGNMASYPRRDKGDNKRSFRYVPEWDSKPKAKKVKSTAAAAAAVTPPPPVAVVEPTKTPSISIGKRIARYFLVDGQDQQKLYFGEIVKARRVQEEETTRTGRPIYKKVWRIFYEEDGETEELDEETVRKAIELYEAYEREQTSTPTKTPPANLVVPSPPPTEPERKLEGIVETYAESFPYHNCRVAKVFGKTLFYGSIARCDLDEKNTHLHERHPKSKKKDEVLPAYLWHVKYDDGDEEDLTLVELHQALELYRSRRIKGYQIQTKIVQEDDSNRKEDNEKDKGSDKTNEEEELGEDEFIVEDVVDRRFKKMAGGVKLPQYQVKWKGWTDENGNSCTWINAEQMGPALLKAAWKKFPSDIPVEEAEGDKEVKETNKNQTGGKNQTQDASDAAPEKPVDVAKNNEMEATAEKASGHLMIPTTEDEMTNSADASPNEDNKEEMAGKSGDETRLDDKPVQNAPSVASDGNGDNSGSNNLSKMCATVSESSESVRDSPAPTRTSTRLAAIVSSEPVQEKKKKKKQVQENFDESDIDDDDNDDDEDDPSEYDLLGTAEIIIGYKSYRLGNFYRTDDGSVLKVFALNGRKQSAMCQRFLPSKSTFLHSVPDTPKDCYLQLGQKEEVQLSKLKRTSSKPLTCDWFYEYDPERPHSSFCYYKKTGRIPSAVAGKARPYVLELFAGAGGMSVGFQNAGMETRWVVEANESAAATLRANHKGRTPLEIYTEDIRDFVEGVKSGNPAYPRKGQVGHIHGSPPCQGFSRANRVGGEDAEENNNLTREFINCIRELDPLTATYENVPGLLRKENRGYIQWVIEELMNMNYQVRLEVLKASDYGDPQNRMRVILFAAKFEMILPSKPKPTHGKNLLPRRTVMDAIGCLENVPIFAQKKGSINLGGFIDHNVRAPDQKPDPEYYVLKANKPARTVTGRPPVHYKGDRYLTVRESALLQSFPWDYTFIGSTQEQYKQVGNAVPVMLATQVAREVAKSHGLP